MRVAGGRICILSALAAAAATQPVLGDDVSDGRTLYETECAYCHFSAELPAHGGRAPDVRPVPVMMATYGPRLAGIVGREAGSDPEFDYSRAFLAQTRGLVWTESNLDRLMADSQAMIPGARMYYRQPDAAIRRKLLAYLETTG